MLVRIVLLEWLLIKVHTRSVQPSAFSIGTTSTTYVHLFNRQIHNFYSELVSYGFHQRLQPSSILTTSFRCRISIIFHSNPCISGECKFEKKIMALLLMTVTSCRALWTKCKMWRRRRKKDNSKKRTKTILNAFKIP